MTLEKLRCVFQLSVRRYLDDIEHAHERGLHFDAEIAEKSLQFVETVCTHQKAEWAGQPFKLSPNQQFILWNLTGWRRENGCHAVCEPARWRCLRTRRNEKARQP